MSKIVCDLANIDSPLVSQMSHFFKRALISEPQKDDFTSCHNSVRFLRLIIILILFKDLNTSYVINNKLSGESVIMSLCICTLKK